MSIDTSLTRKAFAELIGTAMLVAAVVGSGITAQRLSPDDVGLQLLENAAATAAALVAIILALAPVSGAHINPAVTLTARTLGQLTTRQTIAYLAAQIGGGAIGAIVANLMFAEPAIAWSTQHRSSGNLWLAEAVATFGLVLIVFALVRSERASAVPYAVGAYIGSAYFFTASTSFANPAVTLARTLTDTFSGIEPLSAPAFIAFQLLGAAVAILAINVLYPQPGKPPPPVPPPGDPLDHEARPEAATLQQAP